MSESDNEKNTQNGNQTDENKVNKLDELESYENTNKNIEDISTIDELMNKMEQIQKIKLSNNKISNISQFLNFSNLVYLDLGHNSLQKIENLSPLQNLEILILSYNNIKTIGFNLLEVNDGSLIKTLKFNPELISLVLSGNIDYNFETCKYICLEVLNKLDFLDTVQLVDTKKKKYRSSYVEVKCPKGKKVKVRRLRDYIKFRQDDLNQNENNNDNSEKEKDEKYSPETLEKNTSSYYYFQYLNSFK